MSNKRPYRWVFLYWMPYDNNLSRLKTPILKMIQAGVQSENMLVVVESDSWRQDKLSRHLFTKGKVDFESLAATNSASIKVFADYLRWAQSHFEAEKWAIVFLGHGGVVDELSPDDNPGPYPAPRPQWLNIEKLRTVIEEFDETVGRRVELLFLQNCCKGTIEAHYTFRHAARYTLSSQTVLGAPNYYYEPLFRFLGNHPDMDGAQLGQKIMAFERDDMYDGYTLTDNAAIEELPAKLNPLIKSVLAAETKPVDLLKMISGYGHFYLNEYFVDALTFFKTLTKELAADPQTFTEFEQFYKSDLVCKFQQSPRTKYPHYSGLSLFYPFKKKELDLYSYLQVFSDLLLVDLYHYLLKK